MTDVKIIMEYFEVKWLCKMMRKTKYGLQILRTNFRGKSYGKLGVKAWKTRGEHMDSRMWIDQKLGSVYEQTGTVWAVKKLWFLLSRQINELSLKSLWNRLIPSFVENIMALFLRLRRIDLGCVQLPLSLILTVVLWQLDFAL